jgi:hypothetical protein
VWFSVWFLAIALRAISWYAWFWPFVHFSASNPWKLLCFKQKLHKRSKPVCDAVALVLGCALNKTRALFDGNQVVLTSVSRSFVFKQLFFL